MAYTLSELKDVQNQIILGNDPAYKLQAQPPQTPENATASGERNLIRVQWAPVEGVNGYRVAVMTNLNLEAPDVGLFVVNGTKSREFVYNTASNALTRYFAVQSFIGSEFSEFGSIVSATSVPSNSLLSSNTTRQTKTGTTEAVMLTCTISGGTLGANDGVSFIAAGQSSGSSSSASTTRIRWGGLGGTQVALVSDTRALTSNWRIEGHLFNRNSTSAQIVEAISWQHNALQANDITTDTLDTSSDRTLVVTGDNVNAGDSVHVDLFLVEKISTVADSAPPSAPSSPPSSSEPPSFDPSDPTRLTGESEF